MSSSPRLCSNLESNLAPFAACGDSGANYTSAVPGSRPSGYAGARAGSAATQPGRMAGAFSYFRSA
eukprot:2036946-Lingulodinium_polyedra.AAC.1